PKQQPMQQRLAQGWWVGTVAAGKDGDGAALVLQLAGELFHDWRFAGAADSEIANGDDLHAEGRVAQEPDVVEKAPQLHAHEEEPGQGEEQRPREDRRMAAAFLQK